MTYQLLSVVRKHYIHDFITYINTDQEILEYKSKTDLRQIGIGQWNAQYWLLRNYVKYIYVKIAKELIKDIRSYEDAYCQYIRNVVYREIPERCGITFIDRVSLSELTNGCFEGYIEDVDAFSPLGIKDAVNCIIRRNEELLTWAEEKCDKFNKDTMRAPKDKDRVVIVLLTMFYGNLNSNEWLSIKNIGENYNSFLFSGRMCIALNAMSDRVRRAYISRYRVMISNLDQEQCTLLLCILMHFGTNRIIFRQILGDDNLCSCIVNKDISEYETYINHDTMGIIRMNALNKALYKLKEKKEIIYNFDKVVLQQAIWCKERKMTKENAQAEWLCFSRLTKNTNRPDYFDYLYNIIYKDKHYRLCNIDRNVGQIKVKWHNNPDDIVDIISLTLNIIRGVEIMILSELFTKEIDANSYELPRNLGIDAANNMLLEMYANVYNINNVKGYNLTSCFLQEEFKLNNGGTKIEYIAYRYLLEVAMNIVEQSIDIITSFENMLSFEVNGVIGGKNHDRLEIKHYDDTRRKIKERQTQILNEMIEKFEIAKSILESSLMFNDLYINIKDSVISALNLNDEYTNELSLTIEENDVPNMAIKLI